MGKKKSTAEGKGAPPTPQPQQTDGMPSAHMVAMEEARQKSKKMNDELAKKEAEYKKFTFQFRLGLLCMLAFVLFCGGVKGLAHVNARSVWPPRAVAEGKRRAKDPEPEAAGCTLGQE